MTAGWPRALATGIQLLTRLPVPGGASADPAAYAADLPVTLTLLPLIGGLIGGLTAGVLWLAALVWPLALAVLIALAVEAMVTGAMHEDAVADFCDAFGGGRDREDVLRILKDSRVGSYGVLGLGFAVALRAGGLMAAGGPGRAAVALVVSGMVGRLVILVVTALAPPDADRAGLASALAAHGGWSAVGYGVAWAAPWILLGLVVDATALGLGVMASGVLAVWFGRLVSRRIGGATGDCLGCAAFAGMVIVTLAFAVRA